MAQQREARLVNEYLLNFHPTALQWKRVRLGPVADPVEARMYSVIQRWADCIYLEDDVVTILEAKIRPDAGAIGQLEHYDDLFVQTPEFQQYWDKKVRLQLLTAWEDVTIKSLCDDKGIIYTFYQPAWVKEYLWQRQKIISP